MKTIGIDEEIYMKLLHTKHEFETQEKKSLSYNGVIERLIENNKRYQNYNGGGNGDTNIQSHLQPKNNGDEK